MISAKAQPTRRRGAVIVLSAILMVVIFGMAALAIDTGYMFVVRAELQTAADAGALAAGNSMHLKAGQIKAKAREYAMLHEAGGRPIKRGEVRVELGVWDADSNSFSALSGNEIGNAVRTTVRRNNEGLFFAKLMGTKDFTTETSAIAMANPRDIVFVVDTSGSMNDDTEPAWATSTINGKFSGGGFGSVGNDLMKNVYQDFGFGAFPGRLQTLGQPLGMKLNRNDLRRHDVGHRSALTKVHPGTSSGSVRVTTRTRAGERRTAGSLRTKSRRSCPRLDPNRPAPTTGTGRSTSTTC